MRKLLILFMICIFAVSCGVAPKIQGAKGVTRQELIDTYLSGRELDPYEGVWVFDDNNYEVMIIKNTENLKLDENLNRYNYIAIVTDNANSPASWDIGEVKFYFKATAYYDAGIGTYLGGHKDRSGLFVYLKDNGLIEVKVDAEFKNGNRFHLVRVPSGVKKTAKVKSGTGTGFFIGDMYVATNHHVVEGNKRFEVRVDSEKIDADVVVNDINNDLAILKLRDKPKTEYACNNIVSRNVRYGEQLYILGFPMSSVLGDKMVLTEGIVNALAGINNSPTYFQMNAEIQPGNSGGPVFDSHGQILGIASASINNDVVKKNFGTTIQNGNFAVKMSYLRIAMDSQAEPIICSAPNKIKDKKMDAEELYKNYSSSVVKIFSYSK